MRSRIILFSFAVCLCLNLHAQDDAIVFRAVLVNPKTKEVIPYAHIIILNKKQGISSNYEGRFNLLLNYSDSLKISAIGFIPFTYILRDTVNLQKVVTLDMNPMVYELTEVKITPFLSYAELRKAFVNFKPSEEYILYKRFMENMKMITNLNELESLSADYGISTGGPISLIYNAFSRRAKSHRKLKQLRKEDFEQALISSNQAVISYKYNFEIVSRLIDEKDKLFVKEFMEFCNLSDKYLLEVSDIDLYKNLLLRYDAFLENIASKTNPNLDY